MLSADSTDLRNLAHRLVLLSRSRRVIGGRGRLLRHRLVSSGHAGGHPALLTIGIPSTPTQLPESMSRRSTPGCRMFGCSPQRPPQIPQP